MSELLNQETEQKINQDILDTAQRLFTQVEKELNAPDTRKLYVSGARDEAIKVNADPLLEAIALKIIEKRALQECTFNEEELDFFKEELFFYTDLYFTVVTTIIELAAVRRTDIDGSVPFLELFSVMEILMASLLDVPELDNLRKVLKDMSDDYPEKPELEKNIALLVPDTSSKKGIYIIIPPKGIAEYVDDDVLASIDPEENILDTEVAGLPSGVTISPGKGTITVEDASLLEKGIYPIIITTTDFENGTTINAISLPIGINGHAVYEVNAAKQFNDYENEEVLATVTDPDGGVISAKLITESGSDQSLMPPGVQLDPVSGMISISEKQFLVPGSFPLSILTTDERGFESLNQIVLVFKKDHEAEYDVKAPNKISDYRNEQVLATVTDADGGVVSASVNGLPPGVGLNSSSGNLFVEQANLLQAGTYKFNILATTTSGYQKINTVDLTIGNNISLVQYVIEESKKVHNYTNGFVLAAINSDGLAITSAAVLSGELPAGTSLDTLTGEITVSDNLLLKPGNYGLTILVKPTLSEARTHDIELIIEPDYKAVYRVVYGKDVFDYSNGEIIAEVIDCDVIGSAEITEGTLPPGTFFDVNTGEITIEDSTLLVAGKYVLKITTVDLENGSTQSRIALFFGGVDNEAVYTFADPRAIDSYKQGDIIATAEDVDLGVVKASISKGALPLGTSLNLENGNVFISDPSKLHSGTFDNIFVRTVDGVGRTTESELILTFLSDLQISYRLYPAKVVTAYVDDEVLLEIISESSGDIKSAVLSSGDLPSGAKLNSQTGYISVDDHTFLIAGNYPVSLIITDKNGGETTLSFTIDLLEDEPAVWSVIRPTPIDLLTNGAILAYPADPNGAIAEAKTISGTFPEGIVMDPLSGVVTVSNMKFLKAGLYRITIQTTDVVGGITTTMIEIPLLNRDNEAIYKIFPARNVDSYLIDDELAIASDPDGDITDAQIITGEIPPGTTLGTDGSVKVSDLDLLASGIFNAEIQTTDVGGLVTNSLVVIEILQDNEAEYVVAPPMNYDTVVNDLLIAAVSDTDANVVFATITGGAIPAGMLLYEDESMTNGTTRNVGDIVVTDVAGVIPGTYSGIQILTIDSTGGKTQFNLTITINPDNDAIYSVQFARDIHSYRNGDVIAFPIDFDGAIISAQLVGGSLHSGVGINTSTGIISVVARTGMAGGFKNPGIETEDATGGITNQVVGIEVKTLPNRRARLEYNIFIRRFRDRLNEIEALFEDRLASDFTSNRTLMDDTEALADIIVSDLENTTIEQEYWDGLKDAFIRTNFLTISGPVKEAILDSVATIGGGGTPEEIADATKDLSLRTALYGEIFESMLDLAGYRRPDISATPGSEIQTMFDELDLQLDDVRTLPEVAFIFENISGIIAGTAPAHARFIERLNDLLT